MSLLDWLRKHKSKGSVEARKRESSELHERAIKQGGDPFREYRREKILPEKFEYGMNCELDRIYETQGEEFLQKVYERIRKNPNAYRIEKDTSMVDMPGIPILFSVELNHSINAHTEVVKVFNECKREIDKGIEFAKQDMHDEAIKHFNKAIELYPENAQAWLNKGGALAELKKIKESEECINKAIELDSQVAILLKEKGLLDKNSNRYRIMGGESTELSDKEINALECLKKGASLAKLNRHEDAIKCYDKVLEINPNDVDVLMEKGVSLRWLDRYEDAIKCYDKVLEINPKRKWVKLERKFVLFGMKLFGKSRKKR